MKTFRFDAQDGSETWYAHMHSDMSGNVRFVHGAAELEVPGEFLQNLVASWVESRRIAALERMRPIDILLGPWTTRL